MALKKRDDYNAYMNDYMQKRHARLIQEFKEYLGGSCAECGEDDFSELQFDHIDPSTKVFTIAHGWSRKKQIVYEELDKCQLLCRNCHEEKTIEDLGHQQELRNVSRAG